MAEKSIKMIEQISGHFVLLTVNSLQTFGDKLPPWSPLSLFLLFSLFLVQIQAPPIIPLCLLQAQRGPYVLPFCLNPRFGATK